MCPNCFSKFRSVPNPHGRPRWCVASPRERTAQHVLATSLLTSPTGLGTFVLRPPHACRAWVPWPLPTPPACVRAALPPEGGPDPEQPAGPSGRRPSLPQVFEEEHHILYLDHGGVIVAVKDSSIPLKILKYCRGWGSPGGAGLLPFTREPLEPFLRAASSPAPGPQLSAPPAAGGGQLSTPSPAAAPGGAWETVKWETTGQREPEGGLGLCDPEEAHNSLGA